jgi:CheY-like chemotaxis protein
LRILIAEDEPLVAQTLQDMITAAGGENVGVISTALATVGAAGVIHPDAVIMDIHLSGEMDGVDAAGIIRSRRRTPVVFITGTEPDAEMQARLVAHGNVELVFKPIDADELCTAILRAYKADAPP